jgi:hypothetical protein
MDLLTMTLEEIKARHATLWAHCEGQRRRFFELRALVHRELERHGVSCIADLPQAWQDIIDEMGWDLKTPEELSAELTVLGRELESLTVVRELRRIYFLPDTRPG